MKTTNLASYNIYEFECDDELTNKILADIQQQQIIWLPSAIKDSNLLGYLGSKESPVPYYHAELFNWFDDCLNIVSNDQFNNIKLTICDSWLTKSKLGQQADWHIHTKSIYSGLFYLTTHNTADTLFEYNKTPIKNILGNAGDDLITLKTFVSSPKKNKLIFFPSDLKHSVRINKDIRQTRHTLSFNTYYDGVISNTNTSFLDIKVNSVQDRYKSYINKKNNETM